MAKKEIVIDIYNNPLHAEIFKAANRVLAEHFLKPLQEKVVVLEKELEKYKGLKND